MRGSSKNGIISKADVLKAISEGLLKTNTQALSTANKIFATSSVVATSIATPVTVAVSFTPSTEPVNSNFEDIPNSNMRKIIAKRLTESKRDVPHFYTTIEVEIDELMQLRAKLKKTYDLNVSVNDLIIKAAAAALRDSPRVNSKWDAKLKAANETGSASVDISVAVATPNGLITPIVTRADTLGVTEVNSKVKDLAGRAREGKLKPEEFQGGTFSISNLGMFSIGAFSAVINPPQACILAVGAGVQKVLPPRDGQTKPRIANLVTLQLSSDRRVVSEAQAAQFLQHLGQYLGRPQNLAL